MGHTFPGQLRFSHQRQKSWRTVAARHLFSLAPHSRGFLQKACACTRLSEARPAPGHLAGFLPVPRTPTEALHPGGRVTSPHSSSRKPPRQLASVRKKAPGRPCREESSGSNVTPAGDTPFKAALLSRPGQNAAIREVTGGHSREQTQNPQLARNLPLKIPAKARPILSSRGAVR